MPWYGGLKKPLEVVNGDSHDRAGLCRNRGGGAVSYAKAANVLLAV